MGFELDASGLGTAIEEMSREEAMETANRAFSWSNENLTDVGDDLDYETFPVVRSGQPPEWDSGREAAVFGYTHPAAYFFEVGTQTHEIVAEDGVLAFEWPDAPPEVRDMFEHSFPTVFFKSVEVEGIPQTRFLRDALDDAARWLEGRQ